MDKVDVIIKYVNNKSIHELYESIQNGLSAKTKYLKECKESKENANERDQDYWSENIDTIIEKIEKLKNLKYIDEIQFMLISRIYPSEFLAFFKNKNS